jgi:hypothetical protein
VEGESEVERKQAVRAGEVRFARAAMPARLAPRRVAAVEGGVAVDGDVLVARLLQPPPDARPRLSGHGRKIDVQVKIYVLPKSGLSLLGHGRKIYVRVKICTYHQSQAYAYWDMVERLISQLRSLRTYWDMVERLISQLRSLRTAKVRIMSRSGRHSNAIKFFFL